MSDAAWTLVTGGSGFIGRELVRQLSHRGEKVLLLRRPLSHIFPGAATSWVAEIVGDIEEPDLGVPATEWAAVAPSIRRIFHLAALFDVTAGRDRLSRVNVTGTRHVLEAASKLPNLNLFCHVSTVYVCGRHQGIFHEENLDVGQSFRNAYEESKYRAEMLVRERARDLPVMVVRPSMVVDDLGAPSHRRVGAYRLMEAVLRLRVLPLIGPGSAPFNVVPLSFVVQAMTALAASAHSVGGTFHVCDPAPLSAAAFCRAVSRASERRCLIVPLGGALGARIVGKMGRRVRFADACDSLNSWPVFDTSHTTQALDELDLRCPEASTYLERVIRNYRDAARC